LDWDNITAKECIQTYGADFLTTNRNVIVVVDLDSVEFDDMEVGYLTSEEPYLPQPIESKKMCGLYRNFISGVNALKPPSTMTGYALAILARSWLPTQSWQTGLA
jgi:hypothetical protein